MFWKGQRTVKASHSLGRGGGSVLNQGWRMEEQVRQDGNQEKDEAHKGGERNLKRDFLRG